jgi:hypothetical protein
MTVHPEYRAGRILLVVAVNGLVIAFQVSSILHGRQMDRLDSAHNFQARPVSVPDVMWMTPFVAGIVLELTSEKVARVVNVGLYCFMAVWWFVGTALAAFQLFGFRESEHWVVGAVTVGIPAALCAVFLAWLYRVTLPTGPRQIRAA